MANALFVCLHNAGRSQISEALFSARPRRAATRRAPPAPIPPSASIPR